MRNVETLLSGRGDAWDVDLEGHGVSLSMEMAADSVVLLMREGMV